ncbi:MAG: hypothetical protein GY798_15185 [Hyphomicrobiales bacterium]|nr:hypothetical protein [Hyphomicrobiales bacterium]
MPTIVRFLTTLLLLALLIVAAMVYLGNFIEPHQREMSVRIPASRLEPVPIIRPVPEPAAEPAAADEPEAPAE